MNTKDAINQRFIEVAGYIIKNNKDINKGKLADKLDISASTLSEILKKRMNAGTDKLALLCVVFKVQPDWLLLGKGSVFKQKEDELGETSILSTDQVYIIEVQKKLIRELESKIDRISETKTITKLANKIKNAP